MIKIKKFFLLMLFCCFSVLTFYSCSEPASIYGNFSKDLYVLNIGEEIDFKSQLNLTGIDYQNIEIVFSNDKILEENQDKFVASASGQTYVFAKSGEMTIAQTQVIVNYVFSSPSIISISKDGVLQWEESQVNIDGKILPKYPELTEPDESYHGIVYTEAFGKAAYIVKARAQILRDMGACPSPFNSYLTISGLETLSLRMQRHCDSALKIAEWLENHPSISWVNYPGLKSSKYYELAKKYMPKGCSSIIGFGLKGGASAGEKFINSLTIPIHTTNIGDTRSIITYPYLTTHRQLSDEQKIACGVTDDFMRFSVGLEDVEDIIEDLDQAIKKSQV